MSVRRRAGSWALSGAISLITLLPCACTPNIQVHTAENPGATFEQYRTFAFGPAEGPPNGYQPSPRSAELRRRAESLVAAGLRQRGYVPATADKPDITIMIGAGQREVAVHETSAIAEEWQPDDETEDFVEGALVVDAFDGKTRGRVWHGAGRSEIDPDNIDDALLKRTVDKLLATFPAQRTQQAAP